MSFLPGMRPAPIAAPVIPAVITQTAEASTSASGSTHNAGTQSFGAANAGKQVVVVAHGVGSAARTVTGVTIGGVSATQHAHIQNGNNTVAIYSAAVSGASGAVSVSWSGTMERMGVVVYSLLNAQVSTLDTKTATTADPSVSLNVAAGGAALAGAVTNANTGCTWTGLSEDIDAVFSGSSTASRSMASLATPTTQALAVQADFGSNSSPVLAAVSWAPA